jgi:mRNA interferase MazF
LVVSPKSCNQKVVLALFCPITSRIKGYPFEVLVPEGMGVSGMVLSDQLKSLDWRTRKATLIGPASAEAVAMVTASVLALVDLDAARERQSHRVLTMGGSRR